MNWKLIVVHGVAVSVVQLTTGVAEGYFNSQPGSLFSAFSVLSFMACVGIFGHLGVRQTDRPFVHAYAALALYAIVSLVVGAALSRMTGAEHWIFIAIEWLSLVVAATFGVTVGSISLRHLGTQDEA